MTLKGFEPHIQSYKTLISALCKDGRCSNASELFENMLDQQLDADEIIWTVLIDGLLKDAEVDACVHFLGIMESKNRKASVQTYITLSKELVKEMSAADERLPKELTKELSAADENYEVKLYTPKKTACQHEATVDFCSVDEKELTFANLLVRMSDYGCEPTAETYSTIIVGLCKE
nr:hypothetical protein [Tanacetum cinerariifolium]